MHQSTKTQFPFSRQHTNQWKTTSFCFFKLLCNVYRTIWQNLIYYSEFPLETDVKSVWLTIYWDWEAMIQSPSSLEYIWIVEKSPHCKSLRRLTNRLSWCSITMGYIRSHTKCSTSPQPTTTKKHTSNRLCFDTQTNKFWTKIVGKIARTMNMYIKWFCVACV